MSDQIDYKMRDVPDMNVGDCISRRAAVSRMSDLIVLELKCERPPTYNEVYRAMNDLPPAQPQRKYGQWMYGGDNKWCCSECGCVIKGSWKHPLERMNYYCKECGADMREESNEKPN